ncbi:MAG TPA: acetyl-CoA hydrolase/transferase C-terminal domain-containing protein [Hyphomonadaceae bacterium]|nr:acetyl-CoA hydrolase/transferase C-terminal domain-containing protein [Hyphomonadaceae bacterium]
MFSELLTANPEAAKGVELWSCLVPGINRFDYGALTSEVGAGGPDLVTFMASPALEGSIASGRTLIDAMPYSEIGETLAAMEFDLAILHVAPPREGVCSFGISAEAGPLVWPRARKSIAFINERMPHTPGDGIALDAIDLVVPVDVPLLEAAAPGARSNVLEAIGRNAAQLVRDGSTIQSGIGEAPGAMIAALKDHRRLRVHSGLVSAEYRQLAECGALDAAAPHLTGIGWGDAGFYDWLGQGLIAFRSCRETHDRAKIAALPDFVSLGSALEVDLEGAINLEWLGARRVSSVGGAPDFMAGAAASSSGLSIIGLPSATRSGSSRIVPRLTGPAGGNGGKPSVPSSLAGAIVTEHGVADLRRLSADARAKALIAIAAPEHRAGLEAAVAASRRA